MFPLCHIALSPSPPLCVFIFFQRTYPTPLHRQHSPGSHIIHIGPFAFHTSPPCKSLLNCTAVEPHFRAVPLLLHHYHTVSPCHHAPGVYFSLSSRHHFSFLFNPFYSKSSFCKCNPASFMAAGAEFHFPPPRTNG